jgi:hypothetical protein
LVKLLLVLLSEMKNRWSGSSRMKVKDTEKKTPAKILLHECSVDCGQKWLGLMSDAGGAGRD